MPEMMECIASWLIENERLDELKASGTFIKVLGLWADGTAAEMRRASRKINPGQGRPKEVEMYTESLACEHRKSYT